MTEIELTELRDSLVTTNNELDALDVRVTALEDNAVPKGTYFNQLKASFEGSPECCDCDDVGTGEDFTVHTINMRLYESSITEGVEHYGEFVPNSEGSVYLSFKINGGDTETISFARSTLWPVIEATSLESAWVFSGGSLDVLYLINTELEPFGISVNSQLHTVGDSTYFLSTLSRYNESVGSFRFVSSGVNAPGIDIASTLDEVNNIYYFVDP